LKILLVFFPPLLDQLHTFVSIAFDKCKAGPEEYGLGIQASCMKKPCEPKMGGQDQLSEILLKE
jgi:hypothetical protein